LTTREAINEILQNLNEPVLDITDAVIDVPTAIVVEAQLDIARKRILAKGWNQNTVTMSLVPNTSGYIVIPSTFYSVNTISDYVVRDHRLYDVVNNSFIFKDPVQATVINDIQFDAIDFLIADYIIQEASLKAYINIRGAGNDASLRANELKQARHEALRSNAATINGNLLTSQIALNSVRRR